MLAHALVTWASSLTATLVVYIIVVLKAHLAVLEVCIQRVYWFE
jgi:hypothetical protein